MDARAQINWIMLDNSNTVNNENDEELKLAVALKN